MRSCLASAICAHPTDEFGKTVAVVVEDQRRWGSFGLDEEGLETGDKDIIMNTSDCGVITEELVCK